MTAMIVRATWRLPLSAALLLLILAGSLTVARAQDTASIYFEIRTAEGAASYITGFVRSSYGSIDPDGYNVGGFSGAITRLTWNDQAKQMRVSLTSHPAAPLESVSVEFGQTYDCSGSDTSYICTTDADTKPWNANEIRNVRLTFSTAVDLSRPTGSDGFPTATPAPRILPQPYGSRDATFSWSPSVKSGNENDTYQGFHVYQGHMYILDSTDTKVYAYNLETGEHVSSRDWDTTQTSVSTGSANRGLTAYDGRFWSFDSNDYYAYRIGSSGRGTEQYGDVDMPGISAPQRITHIDGNVFLTRISTRYLQRLTLSTTGTPWAKTGLQHDAGSITLEGVSPFADGRLLFMKANTTATAWRVEDPDNAGTYGEGVTAFDLNAFLQRNVRERDTRYDVFLRKSDNANNTGTVHGMWLDVDSDLLYVLQTDSTITQDNTQDGNEQIVWYRYYVDPELVFDPSRGLAQYPPTLNTLEIDDAYREGDTELVDVSFSWAHTSRVTAGSTVMEYRYKSPVTGELGPVIVAADKEEHIIEGLPRDNYDLELFFRYHWYNNQDPTSGSSEHVLVKNPPVSSNSNCEATNTDEYTGAEDDGIDATEDSDTTQPQCAFYVDPGESRYSDWTSARLSITGPLRVVADQTVELRGYTGLVSMTGDMLVTMGMAPAGDVTALARTVVIFCWFVLAVGVGGGIWLVTGMQGGSLYLGSFLFLVIWAGLGPFVATIPYAMAYLPAAGMLLAGGTLVIKRGKV